MRSTHAATVCTDRLAPLAQSSSIEPSAGAVASPLCNPGSSCLGCRCPILAPSPVLWHFHSPQPSATGSLTGKVEGAAGGGPSPSSQLPVPTVKFHSIVTATNSSFSHHHNSRSHFHPHPTNQHTRIPPFPDCDFPSVLVQRTCACVRIY